jgi:hypothetical protein
VSAARADSARAPTVLAALLALLATARAQQGLTATAHTVDGRVLNGMVAVDGEQVTVTNGGTTTLALAELTAIVPANTTVAPIDAPHRVWLRSGVELPATRIDGRARDGATPAALVLHTPGGLVVDVPLSSVRAFRQGGAERPEPALFRGDLAQPGSEDLLYVVKDGSSQRSTVTITALTAQRVEFVLRGRPFQFEFPGVAAVVFGTNTGFAPDRQPKPRATIALTSGERLDGKLLALGTGGARFRLDEGPVLDVPAARVARVQLATDRLAWLSELQPKVEQTPAFDRTWPWTIDRTPVGPNLVLGDRTYTRGLCMVPRTRLTYDLGGRFDVFEAVIGIDARGGPEAHAIFRVLADDAVVFESQPRTRGQPGLPVRVELQRCKTLALEVDFGKNYDLGDLCVFADARVLQK